MCFLSLKLAAIDYNNRTGVLRINIFKVLGVSVVAVVCHQSVLGCAVRSVEHNVLRVVPVRYTVVVCVGVGSVVAMSDAVRTARSGSEDAA